MMRDPKPYKQEPNRKYQSRKDEDTKKRQDTFRTLKISCFRDEKKFFIIGKNFLLKAKYQVNHNILKKYRLKEKNTLLR